MTLLIIKAEQLGLFGGAPRRAVPVAAMHKHDQFSKSADWATWFKAAVEGPRLTV